MRLTNLLFSGIFALLSLTQTALADDALANRTEKLSELVGSYSVQAKAATDKVLQSTNNFQNIRPKYNSSVNMPFDVLATQNITRNLSDILTGRTAEVEEFSNLLRSTASEIKTLPEADAVAKLNSIVAPPVVKDIFTTTKNGERIPDPPHISLEPIRQQSIADYVVGPGISATVAYPSVAEIIYKPVGYGFSTLCSGTIITTSLVLTSAHCFCDFTKSNDGASCSRATYKRGQDTVKPTDTRFVNVFIQDVGTINVEEIVLDPKYKNPKADLALLRLSKPVERVEAAPINLDKNLDTGSSGIIVGFGQHSQLTKAGMPGGALSPTKNSQGVKLSANIKTHKCSSPDLRNGLICFKYVKSIAEEKLGSTCHGDSGGPLFMQVKGRWMLAGVTSGGPDNCLPSGKGTEDYIEVDLSKNATWLKSMLASYTSNNTGSDTFFLVDERNRAYHSIYRFFSSDKDAWSDTFDLPDQIQRMQISVNANPTFSKLGLSIISSDGKTQPCPDPTPDAVTSCRVDLPVSGQWKISVSGSKPQETQVVGSVMR